MNADLAWFKSSYSGAEGGQCLEVARASAIRVRDSKNVDDRNSGPTLAISVDSWATFVKFVAGSALQ
ncbi:DUF397 domain-containing protein [Streptomyces sp. WG-D5]